jgi:hypothetical protein
MKPRYLALIVLTLFLFSGVIAPVAAAIPMALVSSQAAANPADTQSALPVSDQTGAQAQQTAPLALFGCPVVPVVGIYAVPQAGSQPQDFLLQGTCVAFDQRSEDSQWIRIQSGENQVSLPGWVATADVLLERPLDQLPAIAAAVPSSAGASRTTAPASTSGVNACLESVNSLNVRSGPGIAYRSLGYLLKGSCVALTARTASTAWVKSDKGWMAVHYLQVAGDLSLLPVP